MATTTDKAQDIIEDSADAVESAINKTADKASGAVRRAQYATEDALDDSRDVLEEGLICAKNIVRANPIASVAFVAAIAYIWGRIRG